MKSGGVLSGVMLVMAPDWWVIIEQIYCGVTAPVLSPVSPFSPPQQILNLFRPPSPPLPSLSQQLHADFQVEIVKNNTWTVNIYQMYFCWLVMLNMMIVWKWLFIGWRSVPSAVGEDGRCWESVGESLLYRSQEGNVRNQTSINNYQHRNGIS